MSVLNCFNITNFAWVLITLRWHILQNFQRKIISSIRITINNLQNNWNKIHIVYIIIIRTEGCLARTVTDFLHLYDIPKETKYPGKPESMASVPFFKKILYNYFTMNNYFPGLKIINTKGSCHRFGFFL